MEVDASAASQPLRVPGIEHHDDHLKAFSGITYEKVRWNIFVILHILWNYPYLDLLQSHDFASHPNRREMTVTVDKHDN